MRLERRFNLFGYRFVFRTNHPHAADLLSELYAGRTDPTANSPENVYELLRTGSKAGWSIAVPGLKAHPKPTFGESIGSVEACIAGDAARHDSGLHVVHAGVVYAPTGDILLSGCSGAGKTTLSLALAARGLRVGGDDMAVLDPATGLVSPVPRCFHLDERSVALLAGLGLTFPEDFLKDQFVTPGHLGIVRPPPARVRFVLLLEKERLRTPRILPETQAQAASELLKHTGRGYFADIDGMKAIAQLAAECRCFRVWSGELGPTVDALRAACDIV